MPQDQDRRSQDDICEVPKNIGSDDRGDDKTKRSDYPGSEGELLKLGWDGIITRVGSEMGRTGTSGAASRNMSMVTEDDEKPVFGAEIIEKTTDTVIYFVRACRKYPSALFCSLFMFCLMVFGCLYSILVTARRRSSELRADTHSMAKEISQYFSSHFQRSILINFYLQRSASKEIPGFRDWPAIARSWEMSHSASGVAMRKIPPFILAANSSAYDEVAQDLLEESIRPREHKYMLTTRWFKRTEFAPGGIKTFVSPHAGYEHNVGHDLLSDPETRPASIDSIRLHENVLIGPVAAADGSNEIIGSAPVFIDKEQGGLDLRDVELFPEFAGASESQSRNLWGFTRVIFDWDEMLNESQIYLAEERGFLFNITRVGVGSAKAYNATDAVSAILVLNSTMGTISDGIRVCDEVTRGELCIELQPIQGFYPAWALPLCILTPVICLAVALTVFVALITSMEYRQLVGRMIPGPAARYLLRNPGKPFVQPFEEVAIFFADIVGYTSMADGLAPLEVMDMLNEVYTQFDAIVHKHNVYKVETIGDSYMVVCGAPTKCPLEEAVSRVAKFGLEILNLISGFQTSKGLTLQLRCGMSSGPAVGGIVGTSMPRYAIFGDTVNMSSRMESSGVPGKFQTDASTAKVLLDLQHEGFVLEEREREGINVKGKGKRKTFWINEYLGERKFSEIVDFQGTRRRVSAESGEIKDLIEIMQLPPSETDPISNSGISPPHTPAKTNSMLKSAGLQKELRPVEPGPSCATLGKGMSLPEEDAGAAGYDQRCVRKRGGARPDTAAVTASGPRSGEKTSCELGDADEAVRRCSV